MGIGNGCIPKLEAVLRFDRRLLDGIELLPMYAHGFLGKGQIKIALHRAEHQRLSCYPPLKICQVG